MKRFLVLFLGLFLVGCSTPLSTQLSNSLKNDLNTLSSDFNTLYSGIVAECPKYAQNVRILSTKIQSVEEKVEMLPKAYKEEIIALKRTSQYRGLIIVLLIGLIIFIAKK